MPQAIILSGTGRYSDPWHPFAQTTPLLHTLAHDSGWEVDTAGDIDSFLASDFTEVDLLIVNAGTSADTPAEDPGVIERGRANLAGALERGISVLALHCAANSLRDYPEFRQALGGEWVPGHSWHPELAEIHVRCLHDEIVEGLSDFHVTDERYTDLVIDKDVEPLASTHDDERRYVLAWANQWGTSRLIYDALGHDTRSYDSQGHRCFLRRALSWLLPRG